MLQFRLKCGGDFPFFDAVGLIKQYVNVRQIAASFYMVYKMWNSWRIKENENKMDVRERESERKSEEIQTENPMSTSHLQCE